MNQLKFTLLFFLIIATNPISLTWQLAFIGNLVLPDGWQRLWYAIPWVITNIAIVMASILTTGISIAKAAELLNRRDP